MDYLIHFIIIHRGLGSADESSTDEEQGEKILYFYPENISLYDQLSKLIMLESLIEFNSKFSKSPIEYVVMKVIHLYIFIDIYVYI